MDEEHEGDWQVIEGFGCEGCTYVWVAVCPGDAEALECPRCHHMTPIDPEEVPVS